MLLLFTFLFLGCSNATSDPIERAIQVEKERAEILRRNGTCEEIRAAWDEYDIRVFKEPIYKNMYEYVYSHATRGRSEEERKSNWELGRRYCNFEVAFSETVAARDELDVRNKRPCPFLLVQGAGITDFSMNEFRAARVQVADILTGFSSQYFCSDTIENYWAEKRKKK